MALRFLWIDAIRINQEDIADRNHQVGLMRQIYSGASEVVVWLGPSDGGTVVTWEWKYSTSGSRKLIYGGSHPLTCSFCRAR